MSQMHTKLAAALPKGWKLQPLAQVAQVIDCKHRTPVYTDEGYPVVRPRDVRETGICLEQCLRTSHEEYKDLTEKRQPQPGDIVYSRNATFGVASLVDTQASFAIGQDVCLIVPENVDSRYLYRLLNAPFVKQQLGLVISGSTFKRINLLEIRKLQILLPSLEEQRRIAAILDKADAVRRKRKESITLTEELLRSAFLEMFGNPVTNPKAWEVHRLEEFSVIQSGIAKGKKVDQSKSVSVPYMRVANVQDGYIDLSEIKELEVLPSDVDKYTLKQGDLLLTEGGDPDKLGRGAVWYGKIQPCIHQNHIFCVRPNRTLAEPEYLSALIGSERGKRYFLQAAKQTTGIATINKTQLCGFPAILPPLSLQQKYTELVKSIRFTRKHLDYRSEQVDQLFNSLLQRAFRGEL
jgi:type I restriction enzyme S subunit